MTNKFLPYTAQGCRIVDAETGKRIIAVACNPARGMSFIGPRDFIIRACNSHDVMVRTLTFLQSEIRSAFPDLSDDPDSSQHAWLVEITAALAEANKP